MNKEQIKEDQEQAEETRKETGKTTNPDEQERADELMRESEEQKRFSKDVDERDLGGSEQGQSYASGEADRNRGSSIAGSTDNGGAMREGTQEEKVNKGG